MERRKRRIPNSHFVRQANCFIYTAFKLWKLSPNHTVALLVDEMVHSILFSGHILQLKIEPDEMFADDVVRMLFDKFTNATEGFKNKLPRRTPFSCLLELIVNIKGKENPDLVKTELSAIIHTLNCNAANQLIGSALCISHSEEFKQIFSYGVSIPKAEKPYKEIWIALSCVHTWHPHVSYAVMKCSRGETRRETFPSLRSSCTTYDVKTLTEKPPCRSCCDLFSFEPVNHNLRENIYGNCAEVEAISKLLRFNGAPHFDNRTEWDLVRDQTRRDLMRRLQEVSCYEFNIDVVYEPTSTFRPRD